MKKILVILCLLFVVQLTAQDKDKAKLQSKAAKSDEEVADPKKSVRAKTWLSRGDLFVDIWSSPVKSVMPGMSRRDIKLLLASEKIQDTRQEEVDGTVYDIDVYPDKKLYYDESGMLAFWIVTDYAVDKPLFKALEAYKKAAEYDEKGSLSKKISGGLEQLQTKFNTDAMAAYSLHNYKEALVNFEASLEIAEHPLVSKTDSLIILYSGIIAGLAGENEKSLAYLGKALEIGYDQKGDLYATFAEALIASGDTVAAITTLTNGLTKYPTNQSIIIGLINIYLQRGDDPRKVLPYVEQAQQNDPDNSSLYYAEGVVYEQLNDNDNAIVAYKKALEKDAANFYANYSLGALYFNKAVQIQADAAMETDDAKYEVMMKEFDIQFDLALPYLERAYQLNSSERAVLESLKNIYFRLREKGPEMQEKYEYYNSLLQEL
jgi:tetratricopeptide (TPR) repeat protein